jgi:hypothetical protein
VYPVAVDEGESGLSRLAWGLPIALSPSPRKMPRPIHDPVLLIDQQVLAKGPKSLC